MPNVVPVKTLKGSEGVSYYLGDVSETAYIIENVDVDMVLMRLSDYDRLVHEMEILEMLIEGERDIRQGNTVDALESVDRIRYLNGI